MAPHKKAPPPEPESVTFTSGADLSTPPTLRILHLNDVYHLDPSSSEPVGGVARFQTVVNELRSDPKYNNQPALVTLFSGDVFNPSLESSVTKGSHMVPILNNIGVDAACLGNHDLDFSVPQFRYLADKCNFPWLCANLLDPDLGENVPIGHCLPTHMITASNGVKIGLIGIGEREWLATVNALPPNLVYRSATETARELIPKLREQGADVVIILAHAREPNDIKLATNLAGEADLILGGHDHFYAHQLVEGTHVLRSGSDFKQLSYLELRPRNGQKGKWDVDIWRRDMISSVEQHAPTLELVDKLTLKLKKSLEKPVGWTIAPLDARFSVVRTRESNWGNFICDIMKAYYKADCAIMASGTIRGDQIYPPGPIRVKDITDCFPFEDPCVVIKVTGKEIWDALENGVSLYPAQEGRFPQTSNIDFEFDPSKEPGKRITEAQIDQSPIELEKVYVLCTRGYMARGKDGYDSLLVKSEGGNAEEVVDEENGILLSTLLRQYFMALKVMDKWINWSAPLDTHFTSVVSTVRAHHPTITPSPASARGSSTNLHTPLSPIKKWASHGDTLSPSHPGGGWEDWRPERLRARKASVIPFDERVVDGAAPVDDNDVEALAIDHELAIMRKVFRKWCRVAGVEGSLCDELQEGEFEADWTRAIAPRLEGRIRMVGAKA